MWYISTTTRLSWLCQQNTWPVSSYSYNCVCVTFAFEPDNLFCHSFSYEPNQNRWQCCFLFSLGFLSFSKLLFGDVAERWAPVVSDDEWERASGLRLSDSGLFFLCLVWHFIDTGVWRVHSTAPLVTGLLVLSLSRSHCLQRPPKHKQPQQGESVHEATFV